MGRGIVLQTSASRRLRTAKIARPQGRKANFSRSFSEVGDSPGIRRGLAFADVSTVMRDDIPKQQSWDAVHGHWLIGIATGEKGYWDHVRAPNVIGSGEHSIASSLQIDAVEKPGAVLQKLAKTLTAATRDPVSVLGSAADFVNGFRDMEKTNWKYQDRYFHCKVNCVATLRGPEGEQTAEFLSSARELYNQVVDPLRKDISYCTIVEDSMRDDAANRYGRETCHDYVKTYGPIKDQEGREAVAKEACRPLRPNALPEP